MTGTAPGWRIQAREHFDALLEGISSSWTDERAQLRREAEKSSRNQFAESLNQGLRRLRQTRDIAELSAITMELAAQLTPICALFVFRDGQAYAEDSRGLGTLPLTFSPNDGAAFQSVVETKDPVAAIATQAEISSALAARLGDEYQARVFLFPLVIRGEVRAVLFAAGDELPAAALELIAGLGAAQMELLSPPPAPTAEHLISIESAIPVASQGGRADSLAPPAEAAAKWTDLKPDIQALHLKAQRLARLRAAEIRLEHGEAFVLGLERSNLYGSLRGPIDAAREEFSREFMAATPTMVDYLYLELSRTLAHDDNRLLGPEFPGPLVRR